MQGPLECGEDRWGLKGAGALMLPAQPLGPYWGRGHLCCLHRAPGPIASFWSRQEPRVRAGTLGTQFRRGPGNAGRAAAAAKEEGPLECGEGG